MPQWLYHKPETKMTGLQKPGKVFIETFIPFMYLDNKASL